jgi:Asp/Glu/Hydantoin racemase
MRPNPDAERPADTPAQSHPHHNLHLPHIGGEHLVMHQPPAEALAIPGMPSISERGHKYSVVTTLDRAVPLIEDRLKLAGLLERCASVPASGMAVLDLEHDPQAAVEAIAREAARAVEDDHAEVVCLGCGGMAGLMERVVERAGVPVVDGVAAAVTIAESLVRMRLSTSKIRTYAPPRPKNFKAWPPSAVDTGPVTTGADR